MEDVVVVRHRNRVAGGDREEARGELRVVLAELRASCGRRRPGAPLEVDDDRPEIGEPRAREVEDHAPAELAARRRLRREGDAEHRRPREPRQKWTSTAKAT